MPQIEVSQFGAIRFNEAMRFDEQVSYAVGTVTYAARFGMQVRVYEPYTTICRAIYSSGQDENPILSAEFEFVENGCGAFTVKTNTPPQDLDIKRGDRIDIHLMGSEQPWFSGIVTDLPQVDTAMSSFAYKGEGFVTMLDNILVNEEYEDQALDKIVKDLAADYLGRRDILFFSDRIMPVGYTVQHCQFDRVTFKKALNTLAELAHNYVYAIDENRELSFQQKEGKPLSRYANKASQWVGQHLEKFSLSEKTDDIANKLSVKLGNIDDTSKSNFGDFTVEDLASIAFFGEREQVVSAPELKDATDAETWAEYRLEELAWPTIAGKANNLNLAGYVTGKEDILRAEGFLRVNLTRGGLVSPYYEPLNGYFRYEALGTSQVYGTNWLKRTFTARKGGSFGRAAIMVQKVGSPGNLSLVLKKGSTTLETVSVADSGVPEWFSWVEFDSTDRDTLRQGVVYTVELSAASGDSSNYYRILYSTHDAAFSGTYYSSASSGSSWTEDTGKGLIFRSYLVYEDEFILAIKKVKYRVTPDQGIMANIELGEVEQPLENEILRLLRSLKAEELLQQSNVAELA